MAEAKNSFLKGKMNKDVDNRLLPNGEYRDALNISVGKSESQSVGSLQNILGNYQLRKQTPTGSEVFESNTNLVCIGSFVDNENNRIYQFLTDYQDPNPSDINLPPAGSEMKVTVYDPSNTGNPYVTLLEGTYLNFSITNLITGVNLVENLLFWTDNRNQPRKINIDKAISNPAGSPTAYYTKVDQISVAKYAPFTSPELYKKIIGLSLVADSVLLAGQTIFYVSEANYNFVQVQPGDQLVINGITVGDSAIVTNIGPTTGGGNVPIYVSGSYASVLSGTDLVFYRCMMSKNAIESTVNGNDNFLADRFVRFSYRFKYDDNEYSIMAPFTQPAFIPEQKGYFINSNEDAAYRSTVLDWMQNDVNAVSLLIELPDTGGNIVNSYKVKSIDILYKESDSNAVKVVQSVDVSVIALESPTSNIYTYVYNSQKPRKTLPEADTVRVYDKIPIRALSQESVGNRIIYGNFVNQNTPPTSLDYNVLVLEKDEPFTTWVEYPNHTLKQNRTYQVGVVLADKFGRQSSVILSSASPYSTSGDLIFGASSVFFPYKNENWSTDVINWVGDQLALVFNTQITSNRDENLGTPGLYATVSGSIVGSSDGFQVTAGTVYANTYTYTLAGSPAQVNYPADGNFLRGKYVDYVKVLPGSSLGSLTTDGDISEIYNFDSTNIPDIKYSYSINELGWYSYKVVVKQQEQDYYNIYIPGMLAGYPMNQSFATTASSGVVNVNESIFPTAEQDVTCHFVSINDNINKIPRDLSEVGPNQRQYRSSAQIWPRVENVLINPGTSPSPTTYTTNRQYYPTGQPDVVNTIAPTTELNFLPNSNPANIDGTASFNIYQFETSPLINRVSTQKRVGVIATYQTAVWPATAPPASYDSMSPFLGVYETQPVTSALDIFWETSTSGYISDLNTDISSGSDAIVGYSPLEFLYRENQLFNGDVNNPTGDQNSPWVTNWFYFQNSSGVPVYSIDNLVFSTKRRNGDDCSLSFGIVQDTTPGSPTEGFWRIKILDSDIYFGTNVDSFASFVFTFAITHTVGVGPSAVVYTPIITTQSETLRLTNIVPIITNPSVDNLPVYNLTSDPLLNNQIVDTVGYNGAVGYFWGPNKLVDLFYDVLPDGASDITNFRVDSSTGDVWIKDLVTPINTFPLISIGDHIVKVRLKDACTTAGLQTTGGLSTVRTVKLNVPDWKVGCGEWYSRTILNPNGVNWTNTTYGYVNIWRAFRKYETVASNSSYVSHWYEPVPGGGEIEHYVTPYTWQVNFEQPTVGTVPSSMNAFFGKELFSNVTQPIPRAAKALKIQINVTTSTGRAFNFIFRTDATQNTNPGDVYEEWNCRSCTFGGGEINIPLQCSEWKIVNNSAFKVPWSGLRGDVKQKIGGVLNPGEQVGSAANGGSYPIVRKYSLTAAGTSTVGGIITYTGAAVTCPV